ncbi:MAG: threonine synthase [Flavobacteriaceae bacterium]
MNYYSLNFNSKDVGFLDAVRKGLAPDRGLYFPKEIPLLSQNLIDSFPDLSNHELAFHAIQPFVGDDIPSHRLKQIVKETLSFDLPIVPLSDSISTLELFHGPTLAFKDVGARFMARCLAYAHEVKETKKITILVATSGDTGGAVADGFYDVEGIDVVILYPKGKVSQIQEKQLTTLGKNITALEVEGSFDDCQDMVKSAFIDHEIIQKVTLTSANSINIARWLSQMFYYFIVYKNRPNPQKKLVLSVPSGNFGNLCAGMMAQAMGLPLDYFVASTNVNNAVPQYLNEGTYIPKKTIATISNAMDVGDPSNFIRIQKLVNNDFQKLKKKLTGFAFTDSQTKKAIKQVYESTGYITDPHGAVGYLGLKKFLTTKEGNYDGIFLETAHPIKFAHSIEAILKTKIEVPKRIESILGRPKKALLIDSYNDLKNYLLDR